VRACACVRGASVRVYVRQGSLKEISEAYAARDELMHLAISLGLSPHDANVGRGMTLLDVCSGKGVVATLLARSLPYAATARARCAERTLRPRSAVSRAHRMCAWVHACVRVRACVSVSVTGRRV
jgi:hypothetical protein